MIVFICFSNALARGEYVNLASSIVLLLSDGNIFSTVRNSYLSIFPDYNADIFAVYLLISYCNFLSLILLSIAILSFYNLSKRFFLKCEELSDTKVELITKNFQYIFKKNL